MAKPNYEFAKRQKEIAKKKKQDEKRRRKALKSDDTESGAGATQPSADGERKD